MTTKVNQIIEQLKTLTLIESTQLVSQIEEVFGVDTSLPVGGAVTMISGEEDSSAEKVEEKTTFDLIVSDLETTKRVAVLKVIRKFTSLGLTEAKEFTTSLPKTLLEGVSKEEAEEAKSALEEAGAKVTIN